MRNNYIFDPETTKMYPAKYAYEHEMMSEEEKAEFEEGLPRYGFRGVAGMLDLKARLQREVIYPLTHREEMKKYRIHPLNGILLYGPPGCGKTFFAEKFAEETGMFFKLVHAADLSCKYMHETASQIKEFFREARESHPFVLCIDEIEALVPARSGSADMAFADYNESTSVFLSEVNNCGRDGVFVIGTTNAPYLIDPALLRTGRLDKHYFLGLPDEEARLAMLRLHLADRPLERGIDYPRLVELSEGMNASDLETMVNEAALEAAIHHRDITHEMLEDRAIQGRRSIQAPEEDSKQQIQEVHITASNTRVRGFNAYLEEERKVV